MCSWIAQQRDLHRFRDTADAIAPVERLEEP
jgi:hypothetical protein